MSPTAVASLLNDVHADQIFRRGWLHADPHPGNLLVQAVPGAGPRLVLLDHGLTVPLKPELVAALAEMVAALLAGDFARLNRALTQAGVRLDDELDVTTLLGVVGVLLGGQQDDASTGGRTDGRSPAQPASAIFPRIDPRRARSRTAGRRDQAARFPISIRCKPSRAMWEPGRLTKPERLTLRTQRRGPPLGAGVPHWGLGSPTGGTQRREARRTNRRGRGEDAEDAERTRREDGWRRAGVASGPVR